MQSFKWFATGLLAMSGLAQASVTQYVDAGAYSTALASLTNATAPVSADFGAAAAANGVTDSQSYGIVDPGSLTVGALTFTGLNNGNAAGFLVQNTYGIASAFYTHQTFNGVDNSFTITFAAPVSAVAFESSVLNFTIAGPNGNLPIVLSTNTGDVLNAYSSTLNAEDADGKAVQVFNGLISDKPFTSLTISGQTQAINITSISAVSASVPEPDAGVLALMGLGIIGALGIRRKCS